MDHRIQGGTSLRLVVGRCRSIVALAAAFAVALVAGLPVPAMAQAYPNKPLRIVVPYPAGGSIDLAGRRLADALAIELGQPVVVENRPGANGLIGSEAVARSAPDGHTILVTTVPAHAGNPSAYKKLPYDSLKDFTPVTVVNSMPLVLVARPGFPARTTAELVKLAKDKPGQVTYASFGTGGIAHLAAVQLNVAAGTEMIHVPYKGGGPALADVLGGHTDLFFSGINTGLPLIKSGKIHAIAVSGTTRSKSLPDVPTVAETPGFKDYEASVSPLVLLPANVPAATVTRLYDAIVKVTNTPEYRAKLERDGEGEPLGTTPEATADILKRDIDRYAKLFKAGGIVPE